MTPASKGAQVKRVPASRSAAAAYVTGREQKLVGQGCCNSYEASRSHEEEGSCPL